MHHTHVIKTLILAALLCSTSAHADMRRSVAGCAVTENAQISISFSGVEVEAMNVQGKLDGKIAEIKKMAKESGIDSVSVQSTNYNVSTQNYGNPQTPQYQYSGSVSLVIQPMQKAEEFFVLLSKKGHQASLNVNRYQNDGSCIENRE